MENVLLGSAILGLTAVGSHILTKGIEYLYVIHQDLLINEPGWGRFAWRRFFSIYLLMLLMWLLLLSQNFSPLIFMMNMIYSILLIVVIMTDYEQHLIFDRILLGIAVMTVISSGFSGLSLLDSGLGALAGGAIMLVLAVLMRGTLGGGDIKLVFVLGLWQGLDHLAVILLSGFVGGGIAAFILLITGIKKRKDFFAYGPYFVFGAIINMITGKL